jgi:hypothetical protein
MENHAVERILLQLGVRERFEFPPNVKSNVFFGTIDDHPSHWLLAARFRDYPDPKDNGFMLVGWPKKRFSAAQAKELAIEAVRTSARFEPEKIFIYKDKT